MLEVNNLGVEVFFCRPEGVGTLSLFESKGGEVFLPPPYECQVSVD